MENKTQEAYKEILDVLNKHKDIICFDYNGLKTKSDNHLFGIELVEKYGLVINPREVRMPEYDYHNFGEYRFMGKYGETYRRTISWSDNEKQPQDGEILLQISFSTGAYIFGDDYPVDIFQQFFQELKVYSPDYSDTHNKCLYWKLENAKDIFNNLGVIMNKYKELANVDSKRRKIEKLKKEVEALEK